MLLFADWLLSRVSKSLIIRVNINWLLTWGPLLIPQLVMFVQGYSHACINSTMVGQTWLWASNKWVAHCHNWSILAMTSRVQLWPCSIMLHTYVNTSINMWPDMRRRDQCMAQHAWRSSFETWFVVMLVITHENPLSFLHFICVFLKIKSPKRGFITWS